MILNRGNAMNISQDTMAVLNILADDSPDICLLKKMQSLSLIREKSSMLYTRSSANTVFNFVDTLISQGLGENYEKEEHAVNIFEFEGLTIRIQSIPVSSSPVSCDVHIKIFKKECDSIRKWLNEIEKATIYESLPDILINKKLKRI